MNRLLPLLVAALGGSTAAAQYQYEATIDPAQSNATWTGSTPLGPIVGVPNSNFQFGGTLDLSLDAPGAPFQSGAINGGDVYTIPSTLKGEIPNPLPFLPPLAKIDIVDLHGEPASTVFPVTSSNGQFNTVALFYWTSGEAVVDPSIGSTVVIPFTGTFSDPITFDGFLTESSGTIVMDSPLLVAFLVSGGGYQASVTVTGDLHAEATASHAGMTLWYDTLYAGATANFHVRSATPNANAWLAYSLAGPGSTFISQLNVTLGISSPVAAAGPTRASATGTVDWSLPVPFQALGAPVWLQAAQVGAASNAVAATIQ